MSSKPEEFYWEIRRNHAEELHGEAMRPCMRFHPRLMLDGDQWIALLGEDLQTGVVGVGKTPELAMWSFDTMWYQEAQASKENE